MWNSIVLIFFCFPFMTLQSNYKVIFERGLVTKFNPKLGGNMVLKFSKINRTSFALNASFDLYRDMNVDYMKIVGQVYKMVSNDFKLYPVKMTVGICAESKRELFLKWSEVQKFTNVPFCGPMKAGHYYVHNYVPRLNTPNLPILGGSYKIHGIIYENKTFLFEGDVYGSIVNVA